MDKCRCVACLNKAASCDCSSPPKHSTSCCATFRLCRAVGMGAPISRLKRKSSVYVVKEFPRFAPFHAV